MGAAPPERQAVLDAVDEALSCAIGHWRRLQNPALPVPEAPFGGLVVELIEPYTRPHATTHAGAAVSIH